MFNVLLFSFFEDSVSWFRLFDYITVRTLGASTFGFLITLIIGPSVIKKIEEKLILLNLILMKD